MAALFLNTTHALTPDRGARGRSPRPIAASVGPEPEPSPRRREPLVEHVHVDRVPFRRSETPPDGGFSPPIPFFESNSMNMLNER
jgi:hypothetical protein